MLLPSAFCLMLHSKTIKTLVYLLAKGRCLSSHRQSRHWFTFLRRAAAYQIIPDPLSTSMLPISTQYSNAPCTTIKILQCPFQSYPRRLSHKMNGIILLMNHIICATESPCWTVDILGSFQCQDTEKPAQNTFLPMLLSIITSHSVAIKQHPRCGNQTKVNLPN